MSAAAAAAAEGMDDALLETTLEASRCARAEEEFFLDIAGNDDEDSVASKPAAFRRPCVSLKFVT